MIENPIEALKIVSFDVGIKNMAYCVFEISNTECKILDWNVINLMNDSEIQEHVIKCNMVIKKTKNKCNNIAKYSKGEQCFCEKHAKISEFQIPTKECSPTQLKKMKIIELFQFANNKKIPEVNMYDKKSKLLDKINNYYESILLKPIIKEKKNAKECSLIKIGKSIKREFQKISSIKDVQIVLIENQISPLASRMASIQGLLTQYFIMENNENQQDIQIEFISSKNKLKLFSNDSVNSENTNIINSVNKTYKQHKSDGVIYSKQIISKNILFQKWLSSLDTKKKDDLADCFLQGIWYINDKKLSCIV
jgi:hypothetical protein